MPSDSSLSISGRIIAEFQDDARSLVPAEPEFVPVPVGPSLTPPIPSQSSSPPLCKEAAVAQKFWLGVIRQHAEPVPGVAGQFRVGGCQTAARGTIEVEYASSALEHGSAKPTEIRGGQEVGVSDDFQLTLFRREDATAASPTDSAVPILWTEIQNIRFRIDHPASTSAD